MELNVFVPENVCVPSRKANVPAAAMSGMVWVREDVAGVGAVIVTVLVVPKTSWLDVAVKVSLAKVGVAAVWMFWGVESTTVPPAPLSVIVIWLAVPVSARSDVKVASVAIVTKDEPMGA